MNCVLVLASSLVLAACGREEPVDFYPSAVPAPRADNRTHVYLFGVEPMRPTRQLWHRYNPLIETLNDHVSGFQLRIESALAHPDYRKKLMNSELEFAIVEPHEVIELEKRGYSVVARTGIGDRVSGVIAVARDSGLKSVRDLTGKTICFGSPEALASTMLVRMWLRDAGFRERTAEVIFTGSQETALLEVAAGAAHAAGASRIGWRDFVEAHPEAAERVEIRWRTDDLTGPAIMAHHRVPAEHLQQVRGALQSLAQTERGRAALERARYTEFRLAGGDSYDDVWEFLMTYGRTFRHAKGAGR